MADRAQFEKEAEGTGFHADRAHSVLAYEKRNGEIQSEVPYTVTCWRFGEDLAIVFLAGEVVVDYSVRLKTELDWRRPLVEWLVQRTFRVTSRVAACWPRGGTRPIFHRSITRFPDRMRPNWKTGSLSK